MSNIIPTVAVLVFRDNKVLLVRHKEGADHLTNTYGLPSGRIKEGEDERDAAIRELQEETGFITQKDYLTEFPDNLYYASIERKGGEVTNFSWRVFLVNRYTSELKESTETKPEWVSIPKLGELNLLPNIQNAVQAGLKFLQK